MKRFTLICMLALTGMIPGLKAQYVTDYKRTADLYFEQKDYYSAAQYYSKALGTFNIKPGEYRPYQVERSGKKKEQKLKDYEQVVYRLAESYRMYNDFGNAEKYYAETVTFDSTVFPWPVTGMGPPCAPTQKKVRTMNVRWSICQLFAADKKTMMTTRRKLIWS